MATANERVIVSFNSI